MEQPTLAEYNQAKTNINFACRALKHTQEKKRQLILDLEKAHEESRKYLDMLETSKRIVERYEIYKDMEEF